MKKRIRRITETAVMVALLVALQLWTKPLGQLVTGSFVNAVLAVTALVSGLPSGIAVALISPVLAYLLGIAPQFLTVPAIMLGNAVYVVLLHLLGTGGGRVIPKRIVALLCAATAKFAVLYAAVVWLICGVLSDALLASGAMKPPMLQALPAAFSWLQLLTALIGGAVALTIVPALGKIRKP